MVTQTNSSKNEVTYDVHGVGLGEGLYCVSTWELETLRDEISLMLKANDQANKQGGKK